MMDSNPIFVSFLIVFIISYAANGFKDAPDNFFQPLSTRVSVPTGEDTQEMDA